MTSEPHDHLRGELSDSGAGPATLGPYEILREIGRGGMGVVYEARDTRMDRPVALKVLRNPDLASPGAVDRFRREASLAASLRHPNIVTIHDVGTESDVIYLVMDLVKGTTLAETARSLSRRDRIRILELVARAVAFAHGRGIIHRDLKPQNVLLEPIEAAAPSDLRWRVVLSDFGLAKLIGGTDRSLSRTGEAMGTPEYMAPEQVQGRHREMGPWTDVWSLGVMLYDLVVGAKPFRGTTAVQVYQQIVNGEPSPLSRTSHGFHPDLETIWLKALEKQPDRRYPDAGAFADDLHRYLDGEPISVRPPSVAGRVWRRIRRHRWIAAQAALALGILVAGAIYTGTRPGTFVLLVSPAGARVTIDGRPVQGDRVDVPPGRHTIRAELEDHDPGAREEYVGRREAREIRLDLPRQTGEVEIDTDTPAYALIDGTHHGTPLRKHRLPTGRHLVWVEKPGHYRQRLELDVRRDQPAHADVSLPSAVAWSVSQPDWNGVTSVGDVDGDGVSDFASSRYGIEYLVISGATGQTWGTPKNEPATAELVDIDGDGVLECVGCPAGQPGWTLAAWSLKKDAPVRWTVPLAGIMFRRDLGLAKDGHNAPLLDVAGDLNKDGRPDLLALFRGPELRAFSLADGRELWRHALPEAVWPLPRDLVFHSERAIRAIDPATGALRWERRFDSPIELGPFAAGDDQVAYVTGGEWQILSRATGEVTRRATGAAPRGAQILQAGSRIIERHADRVRGWEAATGAELWSLAEPSTHAAIVGPHLLLFGGDGAFAAREPVGGQLRWRFAPPAPVPSHVMAVSSTRLFVRNGTHGTLLDSETGQALWRVDLEDEVACGPAAVDIDRDGAAEIVLATAGRRLVCLTLAGGELFSSWLSTPARHLGFADVDRDGLLDVLVSASGATAVRARKVLWRRDVGFAVRTGPAAFDANGDGTPDALIPMVSDRGQRVAALDGRTGRTLWEVIQSHGMLRPPVIADVTGDGRPELLTRTEVKDGGTVRLLDPATGATVADFPVPSHGYSEPVAGDLDGDGVGDIVAHGWWKNGAYSAFSGRTRQLLWEGGSGTAAWCGAAIADADGDGRAEVYFTNMMGRVLALEGATGRLLWDRQMGAAVRGGAAVARVGNEAHVAVSVMDGRLCVLDAARGKERFAVKGAGGGQSRPVFADADGDGRPEIVSCGSAGLTCVDLSGQVRWRVRAGMMNADPVVADLESDGKLEVLAGSFKGTLYCVELATGQVRWEWTNETKEQIESAVMLADANGDGVLDAIFAGCDRTVTCVSGRGRLTSK